MRMTTYVAHLLAAVVCLVSTRYLVAAPTPHSVPFEFASDRYGVMVGGKPVSVFFAAMNVHFASFDLPADGSAVDVAIVIKEQDYNRLDGKPPLPKPDEFWQNAAVVRPLSRQVEVKTDKRQVTFRLAKAGQYSVERPGTGGFEDEVLFLFANPPEKDIPAATDPSVIHLGPGIHQRSVDLKSGQTLYLAPGAVLFGGINVWNAENVRVRGRGTVVYYGPTSRNVDTGWINAKNTHPMTTNAVKGLSVEGVTFVGRSRGWTIQMKDTFDSTFDNIKVITTFPENLNGDGMDWYGGGRAQVRDSFFRVADDVFAVHATDASAALRTDRGGGGHLPGAPAKETPATTGEVRDITIERCVFWPTVANIFRFGWVNQSLTTRNFVVRDCDVIHISTHEWMGAADALLSVVSPTGKADSLHTDHLFEDIRFEAPAAVLGVNWTGATLRNVRFKNLTFTKGMNRSLLRANGDNIVFENVRIGDRVAASATDLNLTIDGDVRNLEYRPAARD